MQPEQLIQIRLGYRGHRLTHGDHSRLMSFHIVIELRVAGQTQIAPNDGALRQIQYGRNGYLRLAIKSRRSTTVAGSNTSPEFGC